MTEGRGLSRKRHSTFLGDGNVPGLGSGDSWQGWIKLSKPYQNTHLNRSLLWCMSYINRSDPRSRRQWDFNKPTPESMRHPEGWASRVTVWMDSTGSGPGRQEWGVTQRLLGCQDRAFRGAGHLGGCGGHSMAALTAVCDFTFCNGTGLQRLTHTYSIQGQPTASCIFLI